MKKHLALVIFVLFICNTVIAQTNELSSGVISGKVTDALTNQPLEGVSVNLPTISKAAKTDSTGSYRFTGLKPGVYNIRFSSIGYKIKSIFDIQVSNSRTSFVNAELET